MTIAQRITPSCVSRICRVSCIAALSLSLAACAGSGPADLSLGLGDGGEQEVATSGADDLGKAINYWGRKYAKEPANKTAALNYAKNLKAAGQSRQAFLVLQQASVLHGNDRELASEYGRLALENGQVQLASKLLSMADDPAQPDWRIVSGRGAALAKLGKYGEAVEMFKRAHTLAPSNPSVLNNLAMAEAANGNLNVAEALLLKASRMPMARGKVAKNLALVRKLRSGTGTKVAAAKRPAIRQSVGPSSAKRDAARVAGNYNR